MKISKQVKSVLVSSALVVGSLVAVSQASAATEAAKPAPQSLNLLLLNN